MGISDMVERYGRVIAAVERAAQKTYDQIRQEVSRRIDAGELIKKSNFCGGETLFCPRCGEVFYDTGGYELPPVSPWKHLNAATHECGRLGREEVAS